MHSKTGRRMRWVVAVTALVGTVMSGAMSAFADEGLVYVDPEEAREHPDFHIQGEYVHDDWGVQVVAEGDMRFSGFLYAGGLPGSGWNEQTRHAFRGEANDATAKLSGEADGEPFQVTISDGQAQLVMADADSPVTLEPVERTSPTLGQAPPEDAVVLFASPEDAEHWHNGRVDDEGHLMQGVTSEQTFRDHTIHVEFRIPYRPFARGQGRGNSGIYVQGRYEVQMLDSFGLDAQHNDGGGIYSVSAPELNMCYPPLTWQTYDIRLTAARFDEDGNKTANARMTVHHNGVKIHDEVEVPAPTTAAPNNDDETGPGPVFLQDHGNPVRYRNVWVVER